MLLIDVPMLLRFTWMNPFVPGAIIVGFVAKVSCSPAADVLKLPTVLRRIKQLNTTVMTKYVFFIF
jgi:hypothetical protein